MKTNLYAIITALIVLVCSSCFEDKGNYDYTDFQDLEIKNIEKEYDRISFQDTLHIRPEFANPDAYEYLWTLHKAYNQIPSDGSDIKIDTIGTERILAYPVALPTGIYNVILKVTHKENQHATFYNTSLVARTEFSLGYYLLKETAEGNTDVDFHSTEGKKMNDLLSLSLGDAMSGVPTSMGLVFEYCHMDENGEYVWPTALTVCAGKDVRVFNTENMQCILDHSNMFYAEIPDETPKYIFPGGANVAYISDLGYYINYQYPGWGITSAGKFGMPLIVENDFRPSEHMAVIAGGKDQYGIDVVTTYTFDELNHRFMMVDFNGEAYPFGENVQAPASPNEIPENYEIIFFGHNIVGVNHEGYAVFQDKNNPAKRYMYILKMDLYETSNPITEVRELAAPEMQAADLYAVNENNAKVMYCAKDDKLYMYYIMEGKIEPMSLQGFEGGEISYIGNRYWLFPGDKENNFDYFVVATHTNGAYKVYFYKTIGGKPTGTPVKILEGEGKVTKIHFLSPKMTDNCETTVYYPSSF